MHGKGEESVQSFIGKPEGRDHSEDRSADCKTGSERMLRRLAGGVELIQLSQHRGRCPALVNTVANLWVLAEVLAESS